MEYARLLRWEVWNFMSIAHGICEFDSSNIINIKGYNDSGKSAMLRALDVLMFNSYQRDQVQFIKDDMEYFRVMAYFEDGVSILRDKYINGQSLYEMYKDGDCIYSTKVGGNLVKVTEVPVPIQNYLGVVNYLNSRSCYQKQLLVQTTGSENYKMCSEILRSEEIASAGEMLNNDKNKLLADINSIDSQLSVYNTLIADGSKFTEDLLGVLETSDASIDASVARAESLDDTMGWVKEREALPELPELDGLCEDCVSDIDAIASWLDDRNAIPDIPTLEGVDLTRNSDIESLYSDIDGLSRINDIPELCNIDMNRVSAIESIVDGLSQLGGIEDYGVLCQVDMNRENALTKILGMLSGVPDISAIDSEIASVEAEIHACLAQLGGNARVCPNCGTVVL